MSQHTPGPWEASEATGQPGYSEWFIHRDGESVAIASDVTDPETGQPSPENARLLAAAPRMLEALKSFAETDISRTDDSLVRFLVIGLQAKARAAIAAAEGRAE